MLKYIVHKLASASLNFYPNTFYFSNQMVMRVGDKLRKYDGRSAVCKACLMMAIAVADELKPGEICTANITGASNHGVDKGNFRVTVEKLD